MKRTILVTGANGQLGMELRRLEQSAVSFHFVFTDVNELDITNLEAVLDCFLVHHPFAVINCAAYTNVDKAESEPETAYLINETGAANLALACEKFHSVLIHISTDYVFNGRNFMPYIEDNPTEPLGVYGKSKEAGEKLVIQSGAKYIIIRTSWLYSVFGHNFIKTMLRLGKERSEVRVVSDQIGSPTNAADLAATIIHLLDKGNFSVDVRELLHFANTGVASWYDVAKAIFEMADTKCIVKAIPSSEYPLPTKRPHYSVLSTELIQKKYQIEISYWRDSLKRCVEELKQQ